MKITSVRNFDESIAKLSVASPAAVALKSSAAKTVLTVQPLPEVVTAKTLFWLERQNWEKAWEGVFLGSAITVCLAESGRLASRAELARLA